MGWVWKTALAVILIVILAGSVMLIAAPGKETEIIITPGEVDRTIRFGIFGAVNAPGYYSSDRLIRIGDAADLAGGLADGADPENAHLAKWVEDGETVIIPTRGAAEPTITPVLQNEDKIELNSADLTELMKLPGIGEKRAGDIIRLREKKGRFEAPEDLLEIAGISEKLLENIYDLLIIN